jgi:hypothetical protein
MSQAPRTKRAPRWRCAGVVEHTPVMEEIAEGARAGIGAVAEETLRWVGMWRVVGGSKCHHTLEQEKDKVACGVH